MVITGATSGMGLATARQAAREGARLVLAARNEQDLNRLAEELRAQGGEAVPVVADVGDEKQVRRIALAALQRFGGFDTWVNNACVTIPGRLQQVQRADQRRLFDTNFWGVVHGSMVAIEHLKGHGGVLINLGSEVSEVPSPLQGTYAASKHAVKGFTDSLRIELEQEGAPVSVVLIRPAGMETPYGAHAGKCTDPESTLPSLHYSPEPIAGTILHAARHPAREVFVGGAGWITAIRRATSAVRNPKTAVAVALGSGMLAAGLWRTWARRTSC